MSTKRLTAAEVVAELRRKERQKHEKGVGAAEADAGALAVAFVAQASVLYEAAGLIEQNLIETPEQSRGRFERWRLNQGATDRDLVRTQRDGRYASYGTETLWGAWQASQLFRSEQET